MKSTRRTRESKPTSAPAAFAGPEPLFPALRQALDPRGPFLLPLCSLLLTRLIYAYVLPAAAEDAYITFRYARHFASGHGLVFNPGAHVMGFTSPIWTLWMSIGFLFHQNPIVWSRASSIAADLLSAILLAQALNARFSANAAAAFVLFFGVWPLFPVLANSGMETSWMLLLLVLAARLAERDHPAAAPALAALALVRPEGLLAAGVVAIGLRPRRWLPALAMVVLGGLALTLYYGSPIPQSVLAKAHVYGTVGPSGGIIWWKWLIPRPFDDAPKPVEPAQLVVIAMVFTPALISGLFPLWARRSSALAKIAGAGMLIWLGYALAGVAYFYWYLGLPLAALALVAAVGWQQISRSRWLDASLLIFVATLSYDSIKVYYSRSIIEFSGFGAVADYLQQHARPGERVFLEPIGIIGYSCPLVVIDEVGLVSPEVSRRRLQGAGWYHDIAQSQRPEWLVSRAGLWSHGEAWAGTGAPFRSPEERAEVLAGYAVAETVEAARGDRALLVLHRR